ncbi:MAG: MCE family protein [Candidatus Cloacimonetes bacterium]|nr:MCE family protein [Candidatus Cloacimonadota bacterium]
MVSSAQKFRLGIFIVVFSVLMIIFLVLVAGSKIMEKRDIYHIRYENTSVSGLQIGGPVKYRGIGIGRVDDIAIDAEDVTNVIVTVSVKAGTPIKEDMRASLIPIGITGLLQVEITGGSKEASFLKTKSFLPAGVSTFESISGKAEIISEKLERLLNNLAEITNEENRKKINNIINNVDEMITENQQSINNVLTNLSSTTRDLAVIADETRQIILEINKIMQSGEVENIVSNTEKITNDIANSNLERLLVDMNAAIKQLDITLTHIDATHLESRQDILDTIEALKETIEYLNDFSRQISDDPSLLIRSRKK